MAFEAQRILVAEEPGRQMMLSSNSEVEGLALTMAEVDEMEIEAEADTAFGSIAPMDGLRQVAQVSDVTAIHTTNLVSALHMYARMLRFRARDEVADVGRGRSHNHHLRASTACARGRPREHIGRMAGTRSGLCAFYNAVSRPRIQGATKGGRAHHSWCACAERKLRHFQTGRRSWQPDRDNRRTVSRLSLEKFITSGRRRTHRLAESAYELTAKASD